MDLLTSDQDLDLLPGDGGDQAGDAGGDGGDAADTSAPPDDSTGAGGDLLADDNGLPPIDESGDGADYAAWDSSSVIDFAKIAIDALPPESGGDGPLDCGIITGRIAVDWMPVGDGTGDGDLIFIDDGWTDDGWTDDGWTDDGTGDDGTGDDGTGDDGTADDGTADDGTGDDASGGDDVTWDDGSDDTGGTDGGDVLPDEGPIAIDIVPICVLYAPHEAII